MTPTTCFRLLLAEISLYRDQRERELSRRLTFSSPSGGDQFISKMQKSQFIIALGFSSPSGGDQFISPPQQFKVQAVVAFSSPSGGDQFISHH